MSDSEGITQKPKDLFSYLGLKGDGDSFVPLSMGAPGPETFNGCSELLTEATKETLSDLGEEQYTFQYGPCQGDPGFRDEMAKFLSKQYGDTVSSDDVMVTAGATQGLHLLATVMFDSNAPVFMEDPTYFIAVKILREDLGMNIVPVPTDSEGIDVTYLEKQLAKMQPMNMEPFKTPFWSMIYTVPTFNNPKGYCMSPERSRALVMLARKYKVLIVSEDVYNLLHYKGASVCPRRLLSYDNKKNEDYAGHVVSNGTFSKILGPGLRTGWIEAPPRIMKYLEQSALAWSGGAFNHYTSKLLACALRTGRITAHVENLRKEYGERMDIACAALDKHLPSSVLVFNRHGGFFIWLELPAHIDSFELLELAVEKYKVNFIFGASTSPTGGSKNCVRLSISYCNKSQVEDGIIRFCDALKDMLGSSKQEEPMAT